MKRVVCWALVCVLGTWSGHAAAQAGEAAAAAAGSPLFKPLNPGAKLRGFVDLHTHPMAHLGFGGKILHGAPDVGVLMPKGAIYDPAGVGASGATCNNAARRAASVQEALGSCYSSHAGHDLFKNKCGNHVRRLVLDGFETGEHTNKPHGVEHPQGYPSFAAWPRHDDILHQAMWVDWLERAYRGGLRVMVALAVNNRTLAVGVEADEPTFDKESGDLQIEEIKRFVQKHGAWMRIARSARELREIVGKQDKLAVVLGVELDDIGDFIRNKTEPSEGAVREEIRRLHRAGVRYIFPVHVTDNHFGGTAVYTDEFNRANCYQFGSWWALECAADSSIRHRVASGGDLFKMLKLGGCGGSAPVPECAGGAHQNSRGLQALGRTAIDEMMRLGMIIDVDHASQRTVDEILGHTSANRYPLVSGHNGLRGHGEHSDTENSRTANQYRQLAARGGIAGVGWGGSDAAGWLASVKAVETTGIAVALGSDINGLVKQPGPRAACSDGSCVKYSSAFPQATSEGKTWDYNTEGVAHVGLFPDLLRDVEGLPDGAAAVNQLFDGAEAFAATWEKAAAASRTVAAPPQGLTVVSADYGSNCGVDAAARNITSAVATQCNGRSDCTFTLDWRPWGGRDPKPSMCKKQLKVRWRCASGAQQETTVLHTSTPQSVPMACPAPVVVAPAPSSGTPPPPPAGMTVLSADYGGNCNLPAPQRNITGFVGTRCNGQNGCTFTLDWQPWGGRDPSPSMCKKQLKVQWRCPSGTTKDTTVLHQKTPQPIPMTCP